MNNEYPYYLTGTGDIEATAVIIDYCIENNTIYDDTVHSNMFSYSRNLSLSGAEDLAYTLDVFCHTSGALKYGISKSSGYTMSISAASQYNNDFNSLHNGGLWRHL